MSIDKHSSYVFDQHQENLVAELRKLKKNPFLKQNKALSQEFQNMITLINQHKMVNTLKPQKLRGILQLLKKYNK